LIHARNGGLMAGLTILAALGAKRTGSARVLAGFLAGLSIAVAARTLTTFVLWGTLLTTPHASFAQVGAIAEIGFELFVRLTGLLFDREYGLLAYAPIYLLAASGLLLLPRHRPGLSRDLVIVVACYLVPVLLPLTNIHGWTGGWSPAARFLVPVAPMLWLAVYVYGAHAVGWGRLLAGALVALQIAIDAFVWQFPKSLWNDGDGVSAVAWNQWLPSWTEAEAALFAIALCATLALGYVLAAFAGPRGLFRSAEPD
jgi:hypothetical protein